MLSAHFFYAKLASSGYDGVSHWMKEVDILSKRLLLVPVHLGNHWCLATIHLKFKQLCYYDSLNNKNDTCLQRLRDYIIKKSSLLDTVSDHEWSCMYPEVPQQSNHSDCGVFVCMYARYLAKRSNISFSQLDMPIIRRHMVIELLAKKLL